MPGIVVDHFLKPPPAESTVSRAARFQWRLDDRGTLVAPGGAMKEGLHVTLLR